MTQATTLSPALNPEQQEGESFDAYLDRITIYTEYHGFTNNQLDPQKTELLAELNAVYGSNRAHRQAALLRGLLKAMSKEDPQLISVSMEYEGSGDSGQIEAISIDRLQETSPLKDHLHLNSILDFICWDIAYGTHPGFEINDGGRGELSCEKQEDGTWTIELDHKEYYTQTNDFSTEF